MVSFKIPFTDIIVNPPREVKTIIIPPSEPAPKTPTAPPPKWYPDPNYKNPFPPSGGGGGGGSSGRTGGEVGGGGGGGSSREGGEVGGGGGGSPNIIPDPSSPTGYKDPLGQPVSVAPRPPSYGGGGGGSGGGGVPSPSQDFARTQQSNYNKEIENLNKQYQTGQFNYKGYNERAKAIADKYNTALTNYEELVQKAEQQKSEQQVSTIYQKQTGTFKGVPTYETRITTSEGVDRLATQEEYQYLKTQTNELQASTKKDIPIITPVLRKVSEIRGGVSGRIEELKQENKIIGTADALLTYAEATQPATKIKTLLTSGGDFISQYGTKQGAYDIYGQSVPSKSLFYGGLAVKSIAGFIPTSLTELGEYAALGATGYYYPKLTLAAIEGYSAYSFATAQTPEEQVSAIVGGTLPLVFGGLKEFKAPAKKVISYLEAEPIIKKNTVFDYIIKELNLKPATKTSSIFNTDTAVVFKKGEGIIGEELKLIEPVKANIPIKPREILIELDITTKEPSAYLFKKGQRLGEPIDLIEPAKANIQQRKFTQKQIEVNQLARDIKFLEKAEPSGLLKQDIFPEVRQQALKNLRESQIEQIRIESAIESRLEPNRQELLLDKEIKKAGLQKKELPYIKKRLLEQVKKQTIKDIEQIRIESAIESRLEPNKLFETRVKIEDLWREKNLLKDVINEPSQLGLQKFKEDLLIKERQIPKPEVLKSLDILQQEIKFNKEFGLDIRELALRRLREQKPLEIIEKPKFQKTIKTIKDFIDEPVVTKEIKSNDQKLIQVLREPEIIKPQKKLPIETKQESLIPQGIFEGMNFEGKIQKFGDTGKIKSFGELQGRIPRFEEDVQIQKQFDLFEGLIKDVGLKRESIFDNKQKDVFITGIKEKEKLKQPERTIQISEEVQKSINLFYQPIREVQLQRQPQSQSFKQPQSFSFAQPQIEAQLQRQYQRQRYREENVFTDISKFETRILKRFKEDKKKKRTFKQTPLYSVQVRRRGKFTPIRTDLTRSQALQFGSERALGTLARTFRIAKTGKTRETFGIEEGDIPQLRKFREFKIRRGKQIATPQQFVQLTEFNLKSLGEKAEIKQSKLMKNILQ